MTVRIVDTTAGHLDRLEELERLCFSLPWTREMLQSQLPDEQHVFLTAEDDNGAALGYVGMMTVLDEGYISNVAVDPSCRRQGIGRALVEHVIEQAKQMVFKELTIGVDLDNFAALRLYTKAGFDRVLVVCEDKDGRYVKLMKSL